MACKARSARVCKASVHLICAHEQPGLPSGFGTGSTRSKRSSTQVVMCRQDRTNVPLDASGCKGSSRFPSARIASQSATVLSRSLHSSFVWSASSGMRSTTAESPAPASVSAGGVCATSRSVSESANDAGNCGPPDHSSFDSAICLTTRDSRQAWNGHICLESSSSTCPIREVTRDRCAGSS